MDILKLTFRGFLFFCLSLLQARAPQDLILPPPAQERGVSIIRDKNVTFTAEHPSKDEELAAKPRILYEVKGRNRPFRAGKTIALLKPSTEVEPFRWSKDKKWVAVRVKSSGIRAWVPIMSLPAMDDKFKIRTAAPRAEAKASAIDDENDNELAD